MVGPPDLGIHASAPPTLGTLWVPKLFLFYILLSKLQFSNAYISYCYSPTALASSPSTMIFHPYGSKASLATSGHLIALDKIPSFFTSGPNSLSMDTAHLRLMGQTPFSKSSLLKKISFFL